MCPRVGSARLFSPLWKLSQVSESGPATLNTIYTWMTLYFLCELYSGPWIPNSCRLVYQTKSSPFSYPPPPPTPRLPSKLAVPPFSPTYPRAPSASQLYSPKPKRHLHYSLPSCPIQSSASQLTSSQNPSQIPSLSHLHCYRCVTYRHLRS